MTKLNAAGTALVYSTYLGKARQYWLWHRRGRRRRRLCHGHARIRSLSRPLPVPSKRHAGAFVAKLNSSGTALVYSTYLGVAPLVRGVASPWTAPAMRSLPVVLPHGYPAAPNGILVAEVNASGTALLYSDLSWW